MSFAFYRKYNQVYKILFRGIFPLLLLSTGYALSTSPANAENIALGIYPPIMQIQATAPTFIKSPMTVSNESTTPVDIQVLVRPFTQSSADNGQPQYLVPGQSLGPDPKIYQKMSLFDGMQNTDHFTLAPLQKKNVELRINLPKGEPSGDYYFSITFLSKPIATDHVSGTEVAGGVTTNVLLSIGPKDKTTGYVQEFSAPIFVENGPVPFTVHIANTSKHFIVPQGGIVVKNMFGQTIGNITLSQENILAGTSRYLPDINVNPLIKTPHPAAIWGETFLLGPYTATMTIALSGQGPLYRQTIYFFALPLQVLVGSLLGIILIILVVYRVRKKL